ncbi:MAG: oligosaccharide flippase family protein [Alistipes sp.]|nr:oligosaccharide flippase family protein [Alistipes sp.]
MLPISQVYSRLKKSQLFKDSFWALLGSSIGKGLALISGIVIARLLGSEAFGEYGLIRNTLTYIAIVSTFGLGYSATKYVAEYVTKHPKQTEALIKRLVQITLITSCSLAILQIIFAKQLAAFIVAPHLEHIIRIYSPLIILNALTTTQIAILSGLKRFKTTAKINCIGGIAIFLFSCIGTYMWALSGAFGALLVAFLIQTIISHREIKKALIMYHSEEKYSITKSDTKSILGFSLPIALQDSLYAVTHWLSTYIIITVSNYHEVGLITAAATWQSIVIFIPAMLKNVMFSYLSSADDHQQLVRKFLLVSFGSTTIPVLVIALLSNYIAAFYGISFDGLNTIIVVMCVAAIIISLGEVYAFELLSTGHSWVVFTSRIIRDMLTLGCSYIILLRIDSDYALVYALIALVAHIVYLFIMRTLYKLHQRTNE